MKITGYLGLLVALIALSSCGGMADKPVERDSNGVVTPQLVEVGVFKKSPQDNVIGDTRNFSETTKVVIPFFEIQFNKSAGESASASVGFSGPTANMHVNAKLSGVEEEIFARLTNRAYEDLITQFSQAGFEVFSYNDFGQTNTYSSLSDSKYPSVKAKTSVYTANNLRAAGSFTYLGTYGKMVNELGAAVLAPKYIVDFATFGTASSSTGSTARAKVSLGQVAHVWGSMNGISQQGKMTNVSLGQATYSAVQMGEFTDTTSTAAAVTQGVVNVLSTLGGLGTRTDEEKTLQADPAKYEQAAFEALHEANKRLIEKYKSASK